MIKLNIKNLIACFAIGAICLATAFAASNKKNIDVDYNTNGITINYQIVNFPKDEKPFIFNDTMYVPLRFFAETLGYKVEDYLDNYINIGGGDVIRYTTQSALLQEAMDYVGVATPEKAVEVWTEGLKQRNAAIQYSVMTKELKEIYVKDLETKNPNWVTGMSSPWVEGYKIINEEKKDNKTYIYNLKINTATSTGEFEPFYVTIKIVKTDGFWCISEVNGDETSTGYTGFVYKNKLGD